MAGMPIDTFLFAILPFIALFLFVAGTIYRYWFRPFSVSSLSSQFLERQMHFWAEVPFHYGILTVLLGHVVAIVLPGSLLMWNAEPMRLFAFEAIGLAFGLAALFGITLVMVRRMAFPRTQVVMTGADWLLYSLLFVQILTGIGIAIFHSWGSSWFASVLTPYLRSILMGAPAIAGVAAMPILVKIHVVVSTLVILLLPFTRLMHLVVAPVQYLWRKPQVVRWYGDPTARQSQ